MANCLEALARNIQIALIGRKTVVSAQINERNPALNAQIPGASAEITTFGDPRRLVEQVGEISAQGEVYNAEGRAEVNLTIHPQKK